MMNQSNSRTGVVRPFACGESVALCDMTLFDEGLSPGSTIDVFPSPSTCLTYGDCRGKAPGYTISFVNAGDNPGCVKPGTGNLLVNLRLADDSGSTTYYIQNSITRSGGSYNDSINVSDSMPITTFAKVYASWTVAGFQVVATRPAGLQNLGACYSTGLQSATVVRGFASQARLNGTGQSVNFGYVKPVVATRCANAI